VTETEKPGEAHKKQSAADDPTSSLPDADPDLVKKLEKEKALTHPKKQQNTTLLLNAMRTTAAHPFQLFHERAATTTTTTTTTAPSDAVASEGQRSSVTPVPASIPSSQSPASQTFGPSASQDSTKGAAASVKRKKKRTSRVQFSNYRDLSLIDQF
jgi:mediator of RNA polymerase II transcription subunit 6